MYKWDVCSSDDVAITDTYKWDVRSSDDVAITDVQMRLVFL